METKEKKYTILDKMIDDKKALNECIRKGGNLKKVAKERNVKLARPV